MLERLTLPSRRPVVGLGPGQRRSGRLGSSLDLADYRAYAPGDDIRRLDWGAYARHGRLFTRLYAAEEDACVSLWVDTSNSMRWDEARKAGPARGVAGALGYLSLADGDRVTCCGLGPGGNSQGAPLRGRAAAPRLWSALNSIPPVREADWAWAASAARRAPRGLAVLVSDFLAGTDRVKPVISAHRSAGNEVLLVQVLSPEELSPSLQGELRLVDSEGGGEVEVTLGEPAVRAYEAARQQHASALRALASAHEARLVTLDGGLPLRELLLARLLRSGALR